MTAVAAPSPLKIDWSKVKGDLGKLTDLEGYDNQRALVGAITPLNKYLKTGKSRFTLENQPVLILDDDTESENNSFCVVDNKGVVVVLPNVPCCILNLAARLLDLLHIAREEVPSGLIVKNKMTGKGLMLIANADTGDADDFSETINYERCIAEYASEIKMPSVSFFCLAKMLEASCVHLALADFAKTCSITDFVPDEQRPVEKAVKTTYSKNRTGSTLERIRRTAIQHLPPEMGFSLISDGNDSVVWHRPATVVFTMGRTKTCLMGMDESAYFGCEIQGIHKTAKSCYKALTPDIAQRTKGCLRQGEWFMVPVAQKVVPSIYDCAAMHKGETCVYASDDSDPHDYSGVALPVEDDQSARHIIQTRDEGLRFAKDGKIYAFEPSLLHTKNEHEVLRGNKDQWYTFVRNTALRSVSVKGVD